MLHFYLPTEIIMGGGCVAQSSERLAKLGKRALIVTGRRSAKLCGALDDLTSALDGAGIAYTVWDRAEPNPTIASAYECAAAARESSAEFIAAIGGGSPMDTAKAAALLAAQDVAPELLFSGSYSSDALPTVFIPTTSGTGSEVTQYSILTNDAAKTKTTLSSQVMFPKLALLEPKYTRGLPRKTAVNTAIDAFSHCVESFLNKKSDALCGMLALEGCRSFSEVYDKLASDELDDDSLGKLQYISLLGGICIAQTGTAAAHAMGYSLTYFRHIDHGRANGLLLSGFIEHTAKTHASEVQTLLGAMGLGSASKVGEMLDKLLGERESFTAAELEEYASIASKAKNLKNCLAEPTPDEILDIYKNSLL